VVSRVLRQQPDAARDLSPSRSCGRDTDRRHDVRPALAHELDAVSARHARQGAAATRNPFDGLPDEQMVTADPSPAVPEPLDAPAPAPDAKPPVAKPAPVCHVASGPTYTPTGTIPVTTAAGKKSAPFAMAASFSTYAATGRTPSSCEVRQFIRWNEAYEKWHKKPPHSGFPSDAKAGTWFEDRDANDKRYGHRSGSHSDPVTGCGDEYKTGTTHDQANGNTYCARDSPGGSDALTGTYEFQLKVVDTSNGDAERASSSVITINW